MTKHEVDSSIFYDESAWLNYWDQRIENRKKMQQCSRCLFDEKIGGIHFDSDGICNYCRQHESLMTAYPCGDVGRAQFETIVKRIKSESRRKPYDVIVGVSGGTDSSYMIHLAKSYGLRPLAVHYDNTWNTQIAQNNIKNVLKHHDTELWTYVVNNREYDDLYQAMLKSGVPDLEAPTDLAIASVLNMAARKFKIRYVFEGHSYRAEGISPLSLLYMDAKYVATIYSKYGAGKSLSTYPHLWLSRQIRWMLLNRLKKIRPFWYLDYDKATSKALLKEKYDWQDYGGHHLENRITAFYHSYFLMRRFDLDTRVNGFSGAIRSGLMSKKEGLELIQSPPYLEKGLVELVIKRLAPSAEVFYEWMVLPKKYYTDFTTYKPVFERYRPFFYLMAKLELIPYSFYLKYTAKAVS